MLSDEDLVERSLRDPAAFEPLVQRHSHSLHAYFARRAPEAADDLLSDLWLAAYAGRRNFDVARGPVRAWLFGIARNLLARSFRQTEYRHAPTQFPLVMDEWEDVNDRLDAASMRSRLATALDLLAPDQRELFLLVALEGLSPTEAASVLGIAAGTARSRLLRARRRIIQQLAESMATDAAPAAVHTGRSGAST